MIYLLWAAVILIGYLGIGFLIGVAVVFMNLGRFFIAGFRWSWMLQTALIFTLFWGVVVAGQIYRACGGKFKKEEPEPLNLGPEDEYESDPIPPLRDGHTLAQPVTFRTGTITRSVNGQIQEWRDGAWVTCDGPKP